MDQDQWANQAKSCSHNGDTSEHREGDYYLVKINTKLRIAMDGATKNLANIMYPSEDLKNILGKVRGYLYKRFDEESGINLQNLVRKLETCKCEDEGTGLTKMQIIERLGLSTAYIDFINWEAENIKRDGFTKPTKSSNTSKWAKK